MATDFSSNTVSKNIVSQAVPLIFAQIVQMLYNIVDRVYIGHLPGADGLALTGIGLSFPIIMLINSILVRCKRGYICLCGCISEDISGRNGILYGVCVVGGAVPDWSESNPAYQKRVSSN